MGRADAVRRGQFAVHPRDPPLGRVEPIHLLSILVLVTLPLAIWAARRHDVRRHRNAMAALFMGALVVAGAFTFLPGRIMHSVAFGS
jgi:uncharacterized membrane protein